MQIDDLERAGSEHHALLASLFPADTPHYIEDTVERGDGRRTSIFDVWVVTHDWLHHIHVEVPATSYLQRTPAHTVERRAIPRSSIGNASTIERAGDAEPQLWSLAIRDEAAAWEVPAPVGKILTGIAR